MEEAEWQRISANALPWLLETDFPSIRYFALTELVGRPASDSEAALAKAAIPSSPVVAEIFARQHPDGYWEAEDKPHWPTQTIDALSLLMILGLAQNERIARACERIFQNNQFKTGGFTYTGTRSGVFNCFTGNALEFLVYFGYGQDERIQRCLDFVNQTLSERSGLRCSRNANSPCQWGAIAALRGLSRLPDSMRQEPNIQAVIACMTDELLDYPYDFAGTEKRWLKLSAPPAYDLLEALRVLTRHGYQLDPRFEKLAGILLKQQTHDGKWLKGSGGRTFPIDTLGKPSKLITLNALRVFKSMVVARA